MDDRADERSKSDRPPTQPQATLPDASTTPRRRSRRAGPRRTQRPPRDTALIPEYGPFPEQLVVGRIVAARGRKGALRMALITNHPEHLREVRRVYLGDEREAFTVQQIQARPGSKEVIVQFGELTTPEDVNERRGQLVWIDRADAAPLPEGEYYHYQLLGIEVVDTAGTFLGRLSQIIETGANDVYVVRGPAGELLLPALEQVILSVNTEAGQMVVQPPDYY